MSNQYSLEVERIIREIKKERAKKVLLQLPEGLKNKALNLVNEIESKTNAKCFIWLGSCYGACDIPETGVKFDLLVQFGHSNFL